MSIVLNGRLLELLPKQSGTGKNGPWVKQDFVIETPGEYPRKICITAWGDKADEVAGLSEGEELKISVNIESREFNDRWYTDVKAWRIEREPGTDRSSGDPVGTAPPPGDIPPPSDDDLLPF
jgi:hypothetical protein